MNDAELNEYEYLLEAYKRGRIELIARDVFRRCGRFLVTLDNHSEPFVITDELALELGLIK